VPEIKISEVSSRRDRDAFIKFQWRIYANDPVWVPPLIIERKTFLDRYRHPFYRHGDAALFLARQNGEIVGRIMASDDPRAVALQKRKTGTRGGLPTRKKAWRNCDHSPHASIGVAPP